MRKAKNDPDLQVGDKVRLNFKWIDEDGNSKNGPIGNIGIVTKVNSQYFYTTEKLEEDGVMKTRNTWNKAEFQKDGDVWTVTINIGKIRARTANE